MNDPKASSMKLGARPTPQHLIDAATPHQIVGITPSEFLHIPPELSTWGNDEYGDCVTAEEAFAKVCTNHGIFLPDDVVIGWADYHGYLDGAVLYDVMQTMQKYGFPMDGTNYNDGLIFHVNWRDREILQNAISRGPIKLGITSSQQLSRRWRSTNGWFATGMTAAGDLEHCISICGYGSFSWLASQFHVSVPGNPNQMGYAIFTWGSIGIIDETSLQNITLEAWLRSPTSNTEPPGNVYFEALGGEVGKVLSHSRDQLWLQKGYQGEGELFYIEKISEGVVALACAGGESGKYLSHGGGSLHLAPMFLGGGEAWLMKDIGGDNVAIYGMESGSDKYLSHSVNGVSLQDGYQGGGEAWKLVKVDL